LILWNNFNEKYSTWPERGYILYEGKMSYISAVEVTGTINWEDGVENWLQQYFQ